MLKTSKPQTLSIVIPVFNEEGYLAECLDSIAVQVVPPDEVIVVDNNSTDKTVQIAESYPFVRVIHEPRQGIAHARNAGFDAALSDIIGRIDADTHLSPTWTMEVLDTFAAQPGAAALTGRCYFYDVLFMKSALCLHELVYYYLQAKIAGGEILWGSNMALRRDAWQAVRTKCSAANDVPEDIDLSLVLQKIPGRIARQPAIEAAVSMRRGATSPLAIARYLRWWPRVYTRHGRYGAAACIGGLYAITVCAAVFNWPAATAAEAMKRYRPQAGKYSEP